MMFVDNKLNSYVPESLIPMSEESNQMSLRLLIDSQG